MKTNLLLALPLALALALVAPASAKETVEVQKVLKSVRAPELPAKAADLVLKASSKDQEAVTVSVVKAAVALRPASAAAVVGAIAKVAPHRASLAASTAAALVPKQAAAINKAALAVQDQAKVGTTLQKDGVAADVTQAAPRTGAPFVALNPATQEITPDDTTTVPPGGGRDYSNP